MAEISTAFATAFRDFVVDGQPASGKYKPAKSPIRNIGPLIENELAELNTIATGIKWLPNATGTIRVRATANVDIATALNNGDTLNGIVLATGDHVFLPSQTAPAQNGLYTVVASGAASRATFADSAAELERIGFLVMAGTVGTGEQWTLPLSQAQITLGTTPLLFSMVGIAPSYAQAVFDSVAMAALEWAANSPEGLVIDFVRDAAANRDLVTPANSIASHATDVGTFTRALAAYRRNKAGNFESVASGALRFEHDITGVPTGALFENGATNLVTNNVTFASPWVKTNCTVTPASLSQRGLSFAKIQANSVAGTVCSQTIAGAGSTAGVVFSFYAKKGSGPSDARQFLIFNSTTATIILGGEINWDTGALTYTGGTGAGQPTQAVDMGNGIWFVEVSKITGAGDNLAVYCGFGGILPVTGTEYSYWALPQLVSGQTVATSAIETAASAVARPQDKWTKPVSTFHFDAAQGTLLVRWSSASKAGSYSVRLHDGSTNNQIFLSINSSGGAAAAVYASGVQQCFKYLNGDFRGGAVSSISWKAGAIDFVINGQLATLDLGGPQGIPAGITTLDVAQIVGWIVLKNVEYYPRKLSINEMIELQTGESTIGDLPTSPALVPSPSLPILTPRTLGMVGIELNLYTSDMISGRAPKLFDFSSTLVADGERQQDERWTITPTIAQASKSLTVSVIDPDNLATLGSSSSALDIIEADAAKTANGGIAPTRRLLCIGDSTTAGGTFTQRLLDRVAANANGLQLTLVGTKGTGSNKHEGISGWTVAAFYGQNTYGVADNPFIAADGQKFDATYYLSNTGQARPDIVFWHLGINDVFGQTTDSGVHSVADNFLSQLDQMIGTLPVGDVGSWSEVSSAIKHVVATPIPVVWSQDGFGLAYDDGQPLWRYSRNISILRYRIEQYYRTSAGEASGIYLVPWHLAVDHKHGFPEQVAAPVNAVRGEKRAAGSPYATLAAINADLTPSEGTLAYVTDLATYMIKVGPTAKGFWRAAGPTEGIIKRAGEGVHPGSGVNYYGGYYQMGDSLYVALNALVALGKM